MSEQLLLAARNVVMAFADWPEHHSASAEGERLRALDDLATALAASISLASGMERALTDEMARAERNAKHWHDAGSSSPETDDANYYYFDGMAFAYRRAIRLLNGGAA